MQSVHVPISLNHLQYDIVWNSTRKVFRWLNRHSTVAEILKHDECETAEFSLPCLTLILSDHSQSMLKFSPLLFHTVCVKELNWMSNTDTKFENSAENVIQYCRQKTTGGLLKKMSTCEWPRAPTGKWSSNSKKDDNEWRVITEEVVHYFRSQLPQSSQDNTQNYFFKKTGIIMIKTTKQ